MLVVVENGQRRAWGCTDGDKKVEPGLVLSMETRKCNVVQEEK